MEVTLVARNVNEAMVAPVWSGGVCIWRESESLSVLCWCAHQDLASVSWFFPHFTYFIEQFNNF
jgi:hypothetical protein